MQISPESPGVTSGETSSESSSSPQTPLDAGAYFVHAAMNQRKYAILAKPWDDPLSSFESFERGSRDSQAMELKCHYEIWFPAHFAFFHVSVLHFTPVQSFARCIPAQERPFV